MLDRWFVWRDQHEDEIEGLGSQLDREIHHHADDRREMERLQGEVSRLVHELQEARDLIVILRPLEKEPVTQDQYDLLKSLRCVHCGGVHSVSCPRVKRIRFRGDGQSPLEVEYWEKWPDDRVKWIENLYVETPS
jgi:hypothetical protein